MQAEIPSIKKCTTSGLNLLTDPESPWATAPEPVKALFEPGSDSSIKIKEISHPFELKHSKTNICTKFFPSGG